VAHKRVPHPWSHLRDLSISRFLWLDIHRADLDRRGARRCGLHRKKCHETPCKRWLDAIVEHDQGISSQPAWIRRHRNNLGRRVQPVRGDLDPELSPRRDRHSAPGLPCQVRVLGNNRPLELFEHAT